MDLIKALVNHKRLEYDTSGLGVNPMGLAATEEELALRASRFLKAELKRAGLTYADLAERLKEHGLPNETEASIKAKLRRGTFPATFLLGCLAVLGITALVLADL
jgi:2-hydroxychromene-2-carboxylate isomerase